MNIRNEILQSSEGYLLNGQELIPCIKDGKLIASTLQKATEGAARVYACTLSQTGTNAPTAVLLANTIGPAQWTRFGAKIYYLTLAGAFPADRTIYHKGQDIDGMYIERMDDNTMRFYNDLGDSTLVNYPVKIEVYQNIITEIPFNFTATAFDANQIDLAWDWIAEEEFTLDVSIDEVNWTTIYIGSDAGFSHENLLSDNQYFYRVKGKNAGQLYSLYVFTDETTPSGS